MYLVFRADYDEYSVLAVFSDEAKAEAYAEAMRGPERTKDGELPQGGHIGVKRHGVDDKAIPDPEAGRYAASTIWHDKHPGVDRMMWEWRPDGSHIGFTDHESGYESNGDGLVIAAALGRTMAEAEAGVIEKLRRSGRMPAPPALGGEG